MPLIEIGIESGQEVHLSVADGAASAGNPDELDWASVTKDGEAFIKVKNDKGQEVLK